MAIGSKLSKEGKQNTGWVLIVIGAFVLLGGLAMGYEGYFIASIGLIMLACGVKLFRLSKKE